MVKNKYLILLGITLIGAMLINGCGGTASAKNGDTVKVHYTGTLEDGTVFDTSVEQEPLEFTLGEGQLIPGFEQAVIGMKVGESKTVTIPTEEAYGPPSDNLIVEAGRDQFPEDFEPVIGQQLQMAQPDGRTSIVLVVGFSETTVTIDANHPLAGEDLTFEIELVEIE